MNRKTEINVVEKYKIPGVLIARLAKCAATNVSQFTKNSAMSPAMEQKIADAINSIGRVLRKYENIPLDLNDSERILRLITADENATFYCVAAGEPLQYFHSMKQGKPVWTTFLLSAKLFHKPVARAVKEDLTSSGVQAVLAECPYGSEDRREFLEEEYDDVRETTQYREAMGVVSVQQ